MNKNINYTTEKKSKIRTEHYKIENESKYDNAEIDRIYNLIFDNKSSYETENNDADIIDEKMCNIIFLDGSFGSGKTYKIKKVLEKKNSESKLDVVFFDSFQTGFNDNFIYILLLNILENKKIKKYIILFKLNITSVQAWPLFIASVIPIILIESALIDIFSSTTYSFKFPFFVNLGFFSEVKNWHYLAMLLLIAIITTFCALPFIMTLKKEYSVVNRRYYYDLVSKLLGDVLVIDDFERLKNGQRTQIYEFIDYFRQNNLTTKIIILGDLKQVESQEKNIGDVITSEPFVSKYYDKKIILENWKNTFDSQYNEKNLPSLNEGEMTHIKAFLDHFQKLISRRSFEKFLNELVDVGNITKESYEVKSFEELLIENLKNNRKQEYVELIASEFEYLQTSKCIDDQIKKLILCEIPTYNTYNIKNGKEVRNTTFRDELCKLDEYDFTFVEELKSALYKNNGEINEKIIIEVPDTSDIKKNNQENNDIIKSQKNNKGLYYSCSKNRAEFYELNHKKLEKNLKIEIERLINEHPKYKNINQLNSFFKQLTAEKAIQEKCPGYRDIELLPYIDICIHEFNNIYDNFQSNYVYRLAIEYPDRIEIKKVKNFI